MNQFNKLIKTGKVLNAIKCLTDEVLSEILSTKDTNNGKTV